MSSNVNLLSVGAGSTAKVSVKASNRTASSQGSDFSKTLDQAQQARSRDTAKPESDYKSVAKDESTKAEQPEATKPEAADSKEKADAANAANADTKPENAEGASDVQEKGEPDGQQPADGDGSTATDATPAAAMAAAMAEGVIATQGQQPLAELNTYFKGDARLRETPPGSAENAQQTAEQQFGGQKQPVQQFDGQKQPLDSLQAASAMEDMAPVTSDTLSVSQSSQAPQQPGLIVNAGDANIGKNTAMGRQAQVTQQPSDIIGSTGLSKVDVPSSTMPLQPLVEQKQPELQAAGIRQEVSSVDLPVAKGQAQVPQQPSDIIGSTGLSKVDVPSSTMPLQPLVEQKQPELQAAGIRQEVSSVDLPVAKGQAQVPQQPSDIIGSTGLSKVDVPSSTMPLQPLVEQKQPELQAAGIRQEVSSVDLPVAKGQAQVPQQPSDIIGSTGLSKVDVPSSTMPLQPLVEQKQPELQAAGIRQEVSSVDLPVAKGQAQVPQQPSDVIGSTDLSKSDVSSSTMPLQPVQQFVEQKKPEQGIQPAKIMGEGATAGVPHESRQYVPNSIEALLGRRIIRQNVQHVSNANEGHVRTDNGQQLLNMLPGQRTFTTVQENSAVPQKENTVGINQLNDLVGQVEIVQGEGNSRGFAQQQNQNQQGGMANSQGQQQGMQMPGEAAFDVVVPGEEITQENSLGRSRQDNVASFQQILGNAQTTDNVGAINEPQQAQHTSRTYNVPQQIVEQAKLLQNGQNSEMIIKLNPEHLGELSLKVSVNGNGGVTATFHTDNAQVRAILETGMIQLKQLLNEQGIKVDSVEVQTGLPDGQLPDGQAQQGFYQQEQGQHVRSQQIDLKDFEDTSDALAAGPVNNAAADIHDSEGNVIASGVDYSV